jgi:membrane protease YdiL (CAAX protease family)
MTDNVKNHSPWGPLGLLFRMIGIAFLAMFVMAFIGGALPKTASPTAAKLLQMMDTIVIFGLPAFIYARVTNPRHPGLQLGLRPAVRPSFYVLAVLLLLLAFPFEIWLGILNRLIPLPAWAIRAEEAAEQQLKTLLTAKNGFELLFDLVVVAVIPGVFEEMFFRGVVQRLLIQMTNKPWLSICITAAIFSFMHFEFLGFLPRFFLGVLLGAAYWYSSSLWTAILAHALFNGIQVVLLNYMPATMNDANPSIPVYSVLVSAAVVGVLLGVMRKQSSNANPV